MMNYIPLANKYRPQNLAELVGQKPFVDTINNAIKLDRIPNALMLSGIRGVGKTTTARIVSKTINCTHKKINNQGYILPCNICSICINTTNGTNLDVLEMDAASKTSIEDIKEIIDSTSYKPTTCSYKVFIIDEIHMLSKSAFNALLKTLEEPPPFVKFVFATTELKKVPITVISRCQKFELNSISINDLVLNLENICKKENISYDSASLNLIAKASDGSARDSLSILDNAISYCSGKLSAEQVAELLGYHIINSTCDLMSLIIEGNDKEAISLLFNMLQQGIRTLDVFEGLLKLCHMAILSKTAANSIMKEYELNQELDHPLFTKVIPNTHLSSLMFFWQIINKGIEEISSSSFHKQVGEILIIKMIWAKKITLDNIGLVRSTNTNDNNAPPTFHKKPETLHIKDQEDHNQIITSHSQAKETTEEDIKKLFPDSVKI